MYKRLYIVDQVSQEDSITAQEWRLNITHLFTLLCVGWATTFSYLMQMFNFSIFIQSYELVIYMYNYHHFCIAIAIAMLVLYSSSLLIIIS